MNKKISILMALCICICMSYYSSVSFSDEIKNYDENEVDIIQAQPFENDFRYDELIIDEKVHIEDTTMNYFIMDTSRLKIKTANEIVIDSDEAMYIMTYCILNHVEYLDLSEAKFQDDKFSSGTFMPSRYMKEIVLPNTLEVIDKYAFYDWIALEKINFPSSLKRIETAAFSGCTSLKGIELNENLEYLGEQAFLGCTGFKEIHIPDRVNFLGRFCFADCKNLVELYLPFNDKVTLDGNIVSTKDTIFIVYDGSSACKQMIPYSEHGVDYKTTNKVALKAKLTVENLNKEPTVKNVRTTINRGENINIDDLISVDIRGTGAMSYAVKLIASKELMEYPKGKHIIDYEVRYYLSDLDISEINTKMTKVEEIEDIIRSDEKYFVFAKACDEKKKIDLVVTDYSSNLSKSVNELTCANSYILSKSKHKPFMNGFKSGEFKPSGNLTNEETAVILCKLSKYNSDNKYDNNYLDVYYDSWSSNYIGYVTRENIMTGKDDMFRPKEAITRLEFVTAVCKMIKMVPSTNKSNFPDVWGKVEEGYVAALEEKNVISGFKNGSFGPNKLITRAEAVKIIVSILERTPSKGKICAEVENKMKFSDVKKNDWYYIYVLEATTEHYEYRMH